MKRNLYIILILMIIWPYHLLAKSEHMDIHRLFIVGIVPSKTPKQNLVKFLKKNPVAGFMLYGESFYDQTFLKDYVNYVKSNNPHNYELIFAIDQEGGEVSRIKFTRPHSPSALALGATKSNELVRHVAISHAVQLNEIGINLNFAPVLDIDFLGKTLSLAHVLFQIIYLILNRYHQITFQKSKNMVLWQLQNTFLVMVEH